MATNLTLEEWEHKFHQYDNDKSGSLDIKEMKMLLLSNNSRLTDAQIADMFVFMGGTDVTMETTISKDEFLNGIRKIYNFVERVEGLFDKYDADKNGLLSPEELTTLLKEADSTLTEETVKDIIRKTDANRDGQVTRKEFLDALK